MQIPSDGPHGPMTYGYGFDLETLTAAGKAVAEAISDELPKDSGDEMGQSKHQIDENQEINNQSYLSVDFGSN